MAIVGWVRLCKQKWVHSRERQGLAAIGLGAAGVTTTAGYLLAVAIGTSAAAADALEERNKKSKP